MLGSALERSRTARALDRSAAYIRHLLRKRLTLKTMPQVVFSFAATPRRAARIDKLLGQIEREQGK